jgi:hypothetical protein
MLLRKVEGPQMMVNRVFALRQDSQDTFIRYNNAAALRKFIEVLQESCCVLPELAIYVTHKVLGCMHSEVSWNTKSHADNSPQSGDYQRKL